MRIAIAPEALNPPVPHVALLEPCEALVPLADGSGRDEFLLAPRLAVERIRGRYLGIHAKPDPASLIQLPWKPEVGWLASDLWMAGKEVEALVYGTVVHSVTAPSIAREVSLIPLLPISGVHAPPPVMTYLGALESWRPGNWNSTGESGRPLVPTRFFL